MLKNKKIKIFILILCFTMMRIYLNNNKGNSNTTISGLNRSNSDDFDFKIGFNLSSIKTNHEVISINNPDSLINSFNFVINNNIAQYSAYLSKNEDKYVIEVYVFFNLKNNDEFKSRILNKENYRCLVKLVNITNFKNNEEVITVNVKSSPLVYYQNSRLILFEFNKNDFHSFKVDPGNFNVNNIVLAVISKQDYDPDLSEAELNEKLDWSKFSNYKRIVFPHSLVKYQKPILHERNVILKTVSSCVHYTYNIPSNLKNWIDMHLEIGIAEILFYDGTQNRTLTKYIRKMYPDKEDRIKIKPYGITTADEFCDESRLPKSQYPKLQILVKKYCLNFYKVEFEDPKHRFKGKHEQLTVNDCLTHFRKKHEYITYYDLDEFIFPRTLNYFNHSFTCDKSACSTKAFQFKDNQKNSIYNYLNYLVDIYRGDRDKFKLSHINFDHSVYLNLQIDDTKKLFSELGMIANRNKSTFNFPSNVILSDKPSRGYKFEITNIFDLDYIRYLYNSFNSVNLCFSKNNFSLNSNLQRFIYFSTDPIQRKPKCIYRGTQVHSVYIHYPMEVEKDTWNFKPSIKDGHMHSHFRMDISRFYGNEYKIYNVSITNLRIDFEYFYFIKQKFSGSCLI
jgi:hypothetical protein